MKNFINKIVSLYSNNAKFHSFVTALEFAAVGFFSTYSGGIPTNKAEWISLGTGLAGAFYSGVKSWIKSTAAVNA